MLFRVVGEALGTRRPRSWRGRLALALGPPLHSGRRPRPRDRDGGVARIREGRRRRRARGGAPFRCTAHVRRRVCGAVVARSCRRPVVARAGSVGVVQPHPTFAETAPESVDPAGIAGFARPGAAGTGLKAPDRSHGGFGPNESGLSGLVVRRWPMTRNGFYVSEFGPISYL